MSLVASDDVAEGNGIHNLTFMTYDWPVWQFEVQKPLLPACFHQLWKVET